MNQSNRPRAARVLAALGKSLAYLALFLGFQLLVYLFLMLTFTSAQLLSAGTLDLLQLTRQLLDASVAVSLASGLLTLLFLLIFFAARKKHPLAEIKLRPVPAGTAAAGAAIAPLLYAGVSLVLSLLPTPWLEDYAQASAALSDLSILSFVAVALVAPTVEEVVFRGLIQSRLARAIPGWPAVLIASVLFALCHGQPVWMGYAFCLGLVLGTMAWRAGSILPGILAHFVFNAIGQLLTLPQLAQANGLVVLAVLAGVGVLACLLARKGLRALFFPHGKEPESHV